MKRLSAKSLFPLEAYVVVDPDEIRSHFPEYRLYTQLVPERAGELTQREAGYVAEIATAAALRHGYNVLVDGSLRDYRWYREYFARLHAEYKSLRIAVLHITAPRESVFERAANRARDTGWVVPLETIEKLIEHVPISVKKLAPLVDFFCKLNNSCHASEKDNCGSGGSGGEVKMMTEGITWDAFRENWAQTCPRVPLSSSSLSPPRPMEEGQPMTGRC
jgi:predicted kinase